MGIFKKGKRGNKPLWWIDYYHEGRRQRECVGTSKTIAEKALAVRKAEVLQGRYNFKGRLRSPVFESLAEKYLEYSKANKKPSSFLRDVASLKNLKPFFKGRKLEHISVYMIEQYKQGRVKEVKPATLNREILCLKRMYTLAVEWGLASMSPAATVKLLKETPKKERILCGEEEERLFLACRGMPKAIIMCLLNTGMRLRECLDLRWENVSLRERYIVVEHTKNNRIRKIPINDTLMGLFRRLEEKAEWVFPSPETRRPYTSTGFRTSFDRIVCRAGIKGVTPHDLRHSFCTRLVTRGCDLATLRDILGHSSLAMVSRYSHPSSEDRLRAVNLAISEKTWTPNGHLDTQGSCVRKATEV